MKTRVRTHQLVWPGLVLLLVLFLALSAGSVGASDVTPELVPGNPDCQDLGYDFGFKPQPEAPPTGTYYFGDPVTVPAHPATGDSVTITSDGTFFDWTSTLAVDAVIVKGGPNANVYVYEPEALGDTGLHSPINPSGGFAAISHIEFCYDFELTVEKTAEPTFTRTWEWDIDKTVTPSEWHLFTGDTGTSQYTVAVDRTGFTDSDWAVSGQIWIANDTPFDATIEGVSDAISGFGPVAVDCGAAFPYPLPPGQSLHCTYGTPLPDGADRTNTATVETSGFVGGGEATAGIVFGMPTTEVNAEVTVTDTNGAGPWQFSGSGAVAYERTFACDTDSGSHGNTATIEETGQTAEATVTVGCYALGVEKTAETSFNRTWQWTIEKTATDDYLILMPGQVSPFVEYTVAVEASAFDSDFVVEGDIWIFNPNPMMDAELAGVTDLVSPDIAANVDCPSLTVPAGGSLHCTYEADLPDGSSRTNTATATLQNYAFDRFGMATPLGTTDFSGSADVVFGMPTSELDECIDVTDSERGYLATVCADSQPALIRYGRTFGPFADPEECGDHDFPNTATFVTNDTGTTGSSSWNVHVFVACEEGCTLTQGYWKTHSEYGPAPYDDTWALLPDGADTPFFGSGQTWYEVLWTPPKGGNAWYILAHQYIAAQLNVLNGASAPPGVVAALAEAEALLIEYEDQLNIPKGEKADRALAIELYTLLDDYNNGLIGPGHCDE